MLKKGISASLMCLDFKDTRKDLEALREAGVEVLHFDIMDGEFVSNYTLGPCVVDSLRDMGFSFDIHMMVDRPEQKIPYFHLREGDAMSIHAESTNHLQRLLANLKDRGIAAGVAVNPQTGTDVLDYVLGVTDFVLVMTVNPGFAGQKIIPDIFQKVKVFRQYLDSHGRTDAILQVDGNINFENAAKLSALGASSFVCGTAGLFRKDMSIVEAARIMNRTIGQIV